MGHRLALRRMSVKEGDVVDASDAAASTTASLHPLVIMSISDHHTRCRVQSGAAPRICGALMGELAGRVADIQGSFELVVADIDNLLVLDTEFFQAKVESYNKVFPKAEF